MSSLDELSKIVDNTGSGVRAHCLLKVGSHSNRVQPLVIPSVLSIGLVAILPSPTLVHPGLARPNIFDFLKLFGLKKRCLNSVKRLDHAYGSLASPQQLVLYLVQSKDAKRAVPSLFS